MSFILFIFFVFFFLFFLLPYFGAKVLKNLFGASKDEYTRPFPGEETESTFRKSPGKKRRKKIIEKNEGEYIDFEEFKDQK
ncbi:MAG: DUF4834 family protein [Candidatus Azobacteroides sp.]|jgi:hypothetical protein|nr:DUF4834 family protein [Candidatus Azobacteroides sp.]